MRLKVHDRVAVGKGVFRYRREDDETAREYNMYSNNDEKKTEKYNKHSVF